MADRIPLIVDSSSQQVKELPAGDSLILSDNEKLILGTDSDLQIYHTGTASVIADSGTGSLFIQGESQIVLGNIGNAESYAIFNTDGAVQLRHDNLPKFTTTTTGATITGLVTATTAANISQVELFSSTNSVAWDARAAANAYHVTTENTTIDQPTNPVEGAIISIEIAQGGTPYTVAWHIDFEFAASTAPTVTATANKTDIFSFRYNGSIWQEIGRVQNLAQT